MQKAIIGRKVGMTQIFDADGKIIPVTVIQAGPCSVVSKKSVERDGYEAVQLGFEEVPERKLNKPKLGHLKKAGLEAMRYLKEFKLEGTPSMNIGDKLNADVFAEGDCVDVTGTSKGKGTAGTIKRYGQHMQCHTHGVGPVHRSAGSMGSATDPGRVMPGKRLPGRMGAEQVTVMNLDVVKVDAENNMIVVRGAIPGPKGGLVFIRNTVKNA
ncbi:MAG: 50S ribosomal protein L3 [Clostridia bacterium]